MTRVAVLGTGQVGRVLAGLLADVGHDVVVGSRTASDDARTFADAAAQGEVVVNATGGIVSIDALRGSARKLNSISTPCRQAKGGRACETTPAGRPTLIHGA